MSSWNIEGDETSVLVEVVSTNDGPRVAISADHALLAPDKVEHLRIVLGTAVGEARGVGPEPGR